MKTLYLLLLLGLFVSTGCANAFSTTVNMTDGSSVQAYPQCVSGGKLYGKGIEEGVPRSNVRELTSHAGLEMTLIGSALVATGVGLLIWGMTDDQSTGELGVALGGAIGGIGLAGALTGALFLGSSVGSLGRKCGQRSPYFGRGQQNLHGDAP